MLNDSEVELEAKTVDKKSDLDDNNVNSEILKNGTKIFPNPSNGTFKITFQDSKDKYITLYNVNGQKVLEATTHNAAEFDVELKDKPKGVYLIKITSDHDVVTKKVIIQ